MIDFDILTVIIFSILYIIVCLFLKFKHKKDNIYFIFLTLMFIYFLKLAEYTMFPILLDAFGFTNLSTNTNFIPFKDACEIGSFLNVLLTVPLGFGVPFISSVNTNKRILILAVLSGISIELIQFLEAIIFSNGFTMRYIDINDVIFNCIGTILGFLLLKLFARFYLKLKKEKLYKLWRYIYAVCEKVA